MTSIAPSTLEVLSKAVSRLQEDGLIIFPTETVYGLGGNAESEEAVRRIYRVKGRPQNHPIIVHIGDLGFLDFWTTGLPDYALRLSRDFWPGSMTLVLPRSRNAQNFITGGQNSVGIRIPSNLLALQLLKKFHSLGGKGVAAPSANRFGEVSPTTAEAAVSGLRRWLSDDDIILDGGQCLVGIESTIIDCRGELPRVLRPGAVTKEMIQGSTGLELDDSARLVRVSGALASHYAPKAHVYVGKAPIPGAGFIAMDVVPTPPMMIRLANPRSIDEYARVLYSALQDADRQRLSSIVIVPPEGGGLAEAIRDRIEKARTKVVSDT